MQVKKEEVRNRILRAAKEEFLKNGYNRTSLKTIASKANVSMGNLYRYFTNKDELFQAVITPVLQRIITWMQSHIAFGEDGLKQTARAMADYTQKHQDIFQILQEGPVRHYDQFRTDLAEATGRRLEKAILDTVPEQGTGFRNPDFCSVLAGYTIEGIRRIMEADLDARQREEYIYEMLYFQYSDLEKRLP